jgi:hypothetical protein
MTAPGRRSSTFTRLLRHGFTAPSAAERLLDGPELAPLRNDPVLLEALGATADPDLALGGLVRLLEAQPDPTARRKLLDTLIAAKPLRDRLLGVLGASEALADHLARHAGDWQALVTFEPRDLHRGVEEFERGLGAPTPSRCASPTGAACCPSPPATSAAPSTSPRPPPSSPTSPPPPCAPPSASPRRPRPRTPRCAGWP